jgi:hypothetical protein
MVLVTVSGDILVDACRPIYTLSYDGTISFYMTHLTMLSNFIGYITVNKKAESEKTCRVATVAYFKISEENHIIVQVVGAHGSVVG